MNTAAVAQSVGQLRLSLQAQSPVPHLEGKVSKIELKGKFLFCEAQIHESLKTIIQHSLITGESPILSVYTPDQIKKFIKTPYLKLSPGHTGGSEWTSRNTLAQALSLTPEELAIYLASQDNIYTKDLNESHFWKLPPQRATLSSSKLSDNYLTANLDGKERILEVPKGTWTDTELASPFLTNGFLKFPSSENGLQISSIGAYELSTNILLSIDKEGVVSSIDTSSAESPTVTEAGQISIPEGMSITGFSGAPDSPIFYVTASNAEKSTLFAFDKNSFELLGEVDGVNGPISCDDVGNVYFVDPQKTVRIVSSNLSALSGKKITARNSQRLATIQGAAAALDGLMLPEESSFGSTSNESISVEAKALKEVQIGLLEKIKPEIDKSSSLEQIKGLLSRIETLRTKAEFAALPAAFELVDKEIAAKKETLAYPELETLLTKIEENAASSDANLPTIRRQFFSLQEMRASVVLTDTKKRSEIGKRIEKLGTFIKDSTQKADAQAATLVETGLIELSEEIDTCATQEEVLALVMEGKGKSIKEVIGQISDKELREKLQESLNETVTNKITELAENLQQQKLREVEARLAVREELRSLLNTFTETLAKVSDRASLSEQANSPVAKALRNQIEKLPEEEREQAHTGLARQIAERGKVIDFTARVKDLSGVKGSVKFKDIEFPRAGDFELLFEPHFIPLRGRSGFTELVWRDSRGKEYQPEIEPLAISASDTEKAQLVKSTKEEASKYFLAMTPKPPVIRNNWTINDHFETHLAKLARILLFQKQLQQGFAIIEGDAGAAKSGLVQMFCALTNNCLETFACNGQTEKEDLTYLYQYDPEKGTYRLDSGFVEALQTPNTVVLLEEINTLPVPVAKMLNTLLDFRRELFLPDGRKIKADPSVLIIGLQNPQSYAGVNKLSKEFLDRALVMHMDYAKEMEGTRFLAYEAEMYAKYRPNLADLTQEEFYALWDKVINNSDSAKAQSVSTPEREREVKGLRTIVSVANSARSAYRAYQTEESTDPFEFVFSYRSGEIIASLWDGVSPVEDVISEIVLPKIADAVERKAMGALIRS